MMQNFGRNTCSIIVDPIDECMGTTIEDPVFSFGMQNFDIRENAYEEIYWDHILFCVADGHIVSDREVFVQHLLKSGIINGNLIEAYKKKYEAWYESRMDSIMNATAYIYLRASPETCLSRIQERGDPKDDYLNITTLRALDKLFEELVVKCSANVITIDANRDQKLVSEELANMLLRDSAIKWSRWRGKDKKLV